MMRKFPHYHQLNMMDCGPACLRMVAQYYGRHYSLETLQKRSFITREGVSMLGLSDAAESIGMRSTGIRTSVERLTKAAPTPCILHWNYKHFVVLCKVFKRRGKTIYRIADPASQIVDYDAKEFEIELFTNKGINYALELL